MVFFRHGNAIVKEAKYFDLTMADRLSFGEIIRQARKDKEYSQRELAKIIGLNFTYLSKLENNNADYPPSEKVIKSLAQHLDLDVKELTFATGKIDLQDLEILKILLQKYQTRVPLLLKRLEEDEKFAEKVFADLVEPHHQYGVTAQLSKATTEINQK